MGHTFAVEELLEEISELTAKLQYLSDEMERQQVEDELRDGDWAALAFIESEHDQITAMYEELGIPDNPSVAQLLAMKAAIAEALNK